jgi:hypothetical protein
MLSAKATSRPIPSGSCGKVAAKPLDARLRRLPLRVAALRQDQGTKALSARKSLVSSHHGADELHVSSPAMLQIARPSAAA